MHPLARSFVAPLLAVAVTLGVASTAGAGPSDVDGPILQPAPGGATIVLAPTQGCRTLLATGDGDCGVLTTKSGTLVFTVETGPRLDDVLVSRPWTVRILAADPAVPDGWRPVLTTVPPSPHDAGPLFANVTAVATDLTGDGDDELVLGYRSEGTGGFLNVDVVGAGADGTPTILLSTRLSKGVVDVRPGRIVTYSAEHRRTDGNCCPTFTRRAATKLVDDELVLGKGTRLRTREVDFPRSDLG
jgi:hypothetical protein